MIDVVCAASLFALVAFGATAWLATGRAHRARMQRVEQGGGSVWLPLSTQRGAYWLIEGIGRALARIRISANAITLASIPFALAAAVAFTFGHWGIGAVLAALSFVCDTLDGIVARVTRSASDAGEILDAAADRICEGLLLGGIALQFRAEPLLLALVLAAGLGAQQVTYASAKAEVYRVEGIPRGSMRRAERAVYLVNAAAGTALLVPFVASQFAVIPILVGLGVIAIVGNGSAILRFIAIARALRERDRHAHDSSPSPHGEPHAAE
ncbi:hypothetical protein BH09MYX1_BH09MYX1_15110 [soil metagenome]